MKFNLVRNGDQSNITVFVNGEMYVADTSHPQFDQIAFGAISDDESILNLFSAAPAVARYFEKLSERVSVAGNNVYFDGDVIDNSLTQQILRFMEGQLDPNPLIAFFENVQLNPSEHSRENLYRWLTAHSFSITEDGMFIGYKGVRSINGHFHSISEGTAIVNGTEITGTIPNDIDSVVEMPRSAVQFDPAEGCSTGLHVGTFDFASTWTRVDKVLVCEVNPRDVVSVPTDCLDAKLRTCRYVVIDTTDVEYDSPMYNQYDEYDENYAGRPFAGDEDDDDEEYDEDGIYCEPLITPKPSDAIVV